MKKLGRLSAAAFSFATIANKSFATGVEGEGAGMGLGDIVPFALGALLIVCVLFIGYKMDKAAENAPTIKREKAPKKKKSKVKEEYSEAEEREIYANENKSDDPYESDEGEYYEEDSNFDDYNGLNDDVEYEEDDVSLFSTETNKESSFDDIDDNISYNVEEPVQTSTPAFSQEPAPAVESKPTSGSASQSFDSTMVFDANDLNNLDDFSLDSRNNIFNQPIQDETEDDFEYTDAVEGLDAKIDSLDDLDDFGKESVPDLAKVENQDDDSFMNELNKYKEEVEEEEDDFIGFTTKSTSKEDVIEEEEPQIEITSTPSPAKRYTKKKTVDVSTTASVGISDLPQVPEAPSYVEEESKENSEEESSGTMDMGFLNQMEQNLKKNQEARMKKAGVDLDEISEETPEKKGRKPKKQED